MNSVSDEYFSIEAPVEGLYKEQKSRFIALAYPVESEEQVKELLEKARRDYHDARHHCLAYRIGHDGARYRASDDGEPAGSAGRPILGQIDSAGLSDVAIIVVRYFGGIKLGVPGLIGAYKAASRDAIDKAVRVPKIAGHWYRLSFGYSSLPDVMKLVKDMELPQRKQLFDMECSLECRVRLSLEQDFLDRSKNIPNFKYEII